MSERILIKPVISEKSELLSEKGNKYSFVVAKTANKIEIRKAVEDKYNVSVLSVNTVVMPSRATRRMTKSGPVMGTKSSYKKAYVTVADGEDIDFFGDI